MGQSIIPAALSVGAAAATGGLSLGATAGMAASTGGLMAAAAPAAGGIFGSGITLGMAFQGLSGLSSIIGGIGSFTQGRQQAAFAEAGARQELLKGLSEQNRIREQRNRLMAANVVRTAASGISIEPGGIAENINESLWDDAETQLGISRANASFAQDSRRFQAAQLRRQGTVGLLTGVMGGAGTIGGVLDDAGVFG